ncbi:MAG TPA: hypothetical protein VGI81_01685 [Tepidisphaeraceae bacterium]|jgi:hypothetical protein
MKLLGAMALVASLSFLLWLTNGVSPSAAATTSADSTTPPTTQPSGKKLHKEHEDEVIERLRAEHRTLRAKLTELGGEKESGKSAPKTATQAKATTKPVVKEKLTREETIAKLRAETKHLREEIVKLEAKEKT